MRVKREKKQAHAKKILTLQPFLLPPYVVSVALKNMTVSSFCLLYEMYIKKMLCFFCTTENGSICRTVLLQQFTAELQIFLTGG